MPKAFVMLAWTCLALGLTRCSSPLPPPPVTSDGIALKGMLSELLAKGSRNLEHPAEFDEARKFIENYWIQLGGRVMLQTYEVLSQPVHNIILQVGPDQGPILVIGAHYDVAGDLPGADDNGSGTVGLMLLGKKLLEDADKLETGVQLVAFTLEEPPFFQTPNMGSAQYARSLRRAGSEVMAMVSLEMIGYFSNQPGSQSFPDGLPGEPPPDTGNFLCLVGRENERAFIEKLHSLMASRGDLPLLPLIADPQIPGISYSDHHSFWENGFPAMMITDTAFYRNPNYHQKSDTLETLHFDTMAALVQNLHLAILSLAGPRPEAR